MDVGGIVIIGVNVGLALGCGWPLAVRLTRLREHRGSNWPTFASLFAVYVVEAIAFAASMGTNILSVGLAVVWGVLLGVWLPKSRVPSGEWRRLAWQGAFFTTLPAASFLSIPVVSMLGGWSVLSSEAGGRFGAPGFLPWPLNTILGFHILVAGVAIAAKVAATTTVAAAVSRRWRTAGARTVNERAS